VAQRRQQWRDESVTALAGAAVRYALRPAETLATLLDRPDPTLSRWDDSTRGRRVVALAGADLSRMMWGDSVTSLS
jgi:hypothetical protein